MVLLKMKEIAEAYLGKVHLCAYTKLICMCNCFLFFLYKEVFAGVVLSKTVVVSHKTVLFKCTAKYSMAPLHFFGCYVPYKTGLNRTLLFCKLI